MDYQITPLGAAIVEAMPDKKKVNKINKLFKTKRCPTSHLFPTINSVEEFYMNINMKIKGIMARSVIG